MAKSKRRTSAGSPARPESPRRAFRPADAPPPPPQRPPTSTTAGPSTVRAPRPLVPERSGKGRLAWLGAFGSQRIVVAVAALAVLAAFGLLLYAWYDEIVRPGRELALEVGDRSYSMEYFAKRYRQSLEDPASAAALRQELFTDVPVKIANEIERDAILLERAGTLGVSAGQNEIDRDMLLRLNVPVITDTPEGSEIGPNDTFTVTRVMEQAVRTQLQRFDYTLAEYRGIAEAQLIRQKVESYFRDQTPARAPQVRLRLLQFPNEADARIAIQKINSGEATFAELADTVSLDRAGKGKGGERDWLTRGILPSKVDDVAFILPPRTLSEPIDTGLETNWILIEVLERTDERDVTDSVRGQLAATLFNTWLQEQKETLSIKLALTPEKIRWARDWASATIAPGILDGPGTTSGNLPNRGFPNNQLPTAPNPAPASAAPSPGSTP